MAQNPTQFQTYPYASMQEAPRSYGPNSSQNLLAGLADLLGGNPSAYQALLNQYLDPNSSLFSGGEAGKRAATYANRFPVSWTQALSQITGTPDVTAGTQQEIGAPGKALYNTWLGMSAPNVGKMATALRGTGGEASGPAVDAAIAASLEPYYTGLAKSATEPMIQGVEGYMGLQRALAQQSWAQNESQRYGGIGSLMSAVLGNLKNDMVSVPAYQTSGPAFLPTMSGGGGSAGSQEQKPAEEPTTIDPNTGNLVGTITGAIKKYAAGAVLGGYNPSATPTLTGQYTRQPEVGTPEWWEKRDGKPFGAT